MLSLGRVLGIVAILAGTRRAVAFDSWFVDLIDDSITVLFPPVRVSAHLCRVDQDGAIELSRRMSRKGLAHDIHREFEGFELRTHRDSWEHRILYVVDLDCDYAIPLLRAANSSGRFSAPMRWLLLRDGTIAGDSMARVEQTFRNMAVYPDSEMTDPDTINHLTDYENKHIDAVTKANYPWMLHIASRMNATIDFRVTNTWGYQQENGSWNGLTGMLQRREIDIGGTGTYLIQQRIGVIDYIQLYTRTKAKFIFRAPLLSTVSNIFTLPFQRSVWIAIGVFLLLVLGLLYFSSKWEYRRGASAKSAAYWQQFHLDEQTLSDNFMVVLGAFAQQGYSYEPYRVPSRIVTLMLLLAALNLYASYTANIVALLQSTTDSIRTVADLFYSPLKLGAQDVVHVRHYLKSFQDPLRRAIVEKIEPKGYNSSWLPVEEGVRRVKDELFAFHSELGAFYKIMQETYREEEKCGITEIDILNMLYPLLVIPTRSPYLEIVKNAALVLAETGLQTREDSRLYTKKPKCQGQTSFVSIGLTECYFALVAVGYGALLSLVVLAVEHLWHRKGSLIDLRVVKRFASNALPFPGETPNDNATPWSEADPFEFIGESHRFPENKETENGSVSEDVDDRQRQGTRSTIGDSVNSVQ
ncbi:glutamate receptor ionotropic, delta-1-like isoform X2 [Bombus pyrosoma]|uniref:glutamate receptor ionotropic, delta-1-like isoform X2 n=1 Tax=Bombus pyrosoma TaxID=396416 RepID=UPI001CB9A84F|nr:glutamate receptor ionotropic, delta-1-like isoform X2 [Bombus pyrosoma]